MAGHSLRAISRQVGISAEAVRQRLATIAGSVDWQCTIEDEETQQA